MTVYFHRLSWHFAPGQTLSWLIISGQHFAAPVAHLILVFALRICCLPKQHTVSSSSTNPTRSEGSGKQCAIISACPLIRGPAATGFHGAHLQGHRCYQGESEVSWSPPRCTHTYTQVGNYNISFMSTWSTGGTCNSESHQEMCNTFKPQRYWAMPDINVWRYLKQRHVWIQPFCTTFHACGGLLCENAAKSPQSRERGHKKWKANTKDIGEKCDTVLGNGAAF